MGDSTVMALQLNGSTGITLPDSSTVTSNQTIAFNAWINTASSSFANLAPWIFNATLFNRGNHYSTSTGRFTAPKAGVYAFGCSVGDQNQAQFYSGSIITFYKNGVAYRDILEGESTNAAHWETHGGTLMDLNVGDYVDIRCRGGSVTLTAGNDGYAYRNSFYGYLVGE